MRSDRSSRDGGFSLVEMLIVIVVLGVLATGTVFAVRGVVDRGEESACGADARVLRSAAAVYMVERSVDAVPATAPLDGDEFERTLVDAELINSVSALYDLSSDGSVSSSGEPCT